MVIVSVACIFRIVLRVTSLVNQVAAIVRAVLGLRIISSVNLAAAIARSATRRQLTVDIDRGAREAASTFQFAAPVLPARPVGSYLRGPSM